jgi:hypothetical protein
VRRSNWGRSIARRMISPLERSPITEPVRRPDWSGGQATTDFDEVT